MHNCFYRLDCDSAEKSDVCLNNTQMASYMYEMPSLMNIRMSSYENSYYPCVTEQTNAINCESFTECAGNSTLQTSNAPICCTAYLSCAASSRITATIPLNSTLVGSTAIRCDSNAACSDITGTISAQNGGHIYMAGRSAAEIETVSEYGVIATNENYNIYCTSELR